MKFRTSALLLPAVGLLAASAPAQYLLVVESTNKRVLLLSDFDGSIVNPIYIDLAAGGAATPIEAGVVGNEIWVSDQLLDGFTRYSLDGTTSLGPLTGGLDNVRGFAYSNGYLWVANSGTGSGAPGQTLVQMTTSGTILGSFASPDPFDVFPYNGELLLADGNTDDLRRYDYSGNYLGNFHSSDGVTGIDWVEQISKRRTNDHVLATNFSAPIGIYEYDSTGAQVNYWAVGNGNRGVAELGNGKLLWTDGQGIHTIDPNTLATADIVAGVSGRFVTYFAGSSTNTTPYCFGDGTGTACPCANNGAAGNGCANSLSPAGASLVATGIASVTTANDTFLLSAGSVPNGPGLYFQGTTQLGGGLGVVFGDGLRCVGGTIIRLGIVAGVSNASTYPTGVTPPNNVPISVKGLVIAGQSANYQLWYRDSDPVFCNPQVFNLTNAVNVVWTP